MYCPNCGCYNDENAAFCGSCGTPLRTEQNSPAGNSLVRLPALCRRIQADRK